MRKPWLRILLVSSLMACPVGPVAAQQQTAADSRVQIEALSFPRLRFDTPEPRRDTLSNGVPVVLLEDHGLPVFHATIVSKVGAAHLPDSLWGIGREADTMIRTGGSTRLSPDSVDQLLDLYALRFSVDIGNERSRATLTGLARYRDVALELAFDLLRNPTNAPSGIRILVAEQEETWRRRNDEPSSVLQRAWNHVMLGDHPLGRTLVTPEEIAAFTPERFRWVQERIFCPGNVVIGISGDVDGRTLMPTLESLTRGWEPCKPGLRDPPPVRYAKGPQVVLVHQDINQSQIRMGRGGGIKLGDTPDYFASQVLNLLLGGGELSVSRNAFSRLFTRVRNDAGLAYNVFSVWEASPTGERLFFADAQVRADRTVAALQLMRQVIGSMVSEPVAGRELKLARNNETSSFVFRFENPVQIVQEQLSNEIDGLPFDWFDVYLRGIQAVTPLHLQQVAERYLRPNELVVVVVGKPSAFDRPLSEVGPVTTLSLDSITH